MGVSFALELEFTATKFIKIQLSIQDDLLRAHSTLLPVDDEELSCQPSIQPVIAQKVE